jgi:hypothetical protein
MDNQQPISENQTARQNPWAAPVDRLKVSDLPGEAINLNVEGRHLTGLSKGFGQLWQKTYRIRLQGAHVSPQEVIKTWKEKFPQFWPKGNRFYGSVGGIAPGDVAVLNLAGPGGVTGPGGAPMISTGVMVIFADDESFSFMTPEGHMFAGMITFSAFKQGEDTVAQTQVLVRANDPIYETTFRLGFGHRAENAFWAQTLRSLALYFGVEAAPEEKITLVDPKVQWSEAGNIRYNAAMRTGAYYLLAPVRWVSNLFKPK